MYAYIQDQESRHALKGAGRRAILKDPSIALEVFQLKVALVAHRVATSKYRWFWKS